MFVLTIDQHASRRGDDLVPELLDRLNAGPRGGVDGPHRAFERTAGDEVQGVLVTPESCVDTLALLLRRGGWNVGLGWGPVQEPLPQSVRAGRGEAFVSAREAVTRAKTSPHRLAVVGADPYRAEQVETTLWLWATVLDRRTDRGWEIADLLAQGLNHREAGERLGISQPAATQRARAAGVIEEHRARRLAAQLLGATREEDVGP